MATDTDLGDFRTTDAYNRDKNDIRKIAPNPENLAGLALTPLDRRTQGAQWQQTRQNSYRLLDKAAARLNEQGRCTVRYTALPFAASG